MRWFEAGKEIARDEGQYRDGKPNGYGVITYTDGERRKVFWRDGRFIEHNDVIATQGTPEPRTTPRPRRDEIKLVTEGGVLVVPVTINNAIKLDFMIDSGSADVSIPADVVMTLLRTKTLAASDFLGKRIYRLVDGSTVPSETFRIRVLKVGGNEIENVAGSIADVEGRLLLGQSFLSRFKSWSIDNQQQVLVLEQKSSP